MENEKAIKVLIKMADDFQIPIESERGQAIEKALFEFAKGISAKEKKSNEQNK